MEHEDFQTIRFDRPATLLWRPQSDATETREHFARLQDALRFADGLCDGARKTAWIVLDQGLLAPEDLPLLAKLTAIGLTPEGAPAHAVAAPSPERRHATR